MHFEDILAPLHRNEIVQRFGTALHKLFFEKAGRFSEDLNFVQIKAGPIGKTIDAIRECLDPWLGKPSWKQNQVEEAYEILFRDFLPKLAADPWKEFNNNSN